MVEEISAPQLNQEALIHLLQLATAQSLEQATDLARLNLELRVSGNPEGVGENFDVLA